MEFHFTDIRFTYPVLDSSALRSDFKCINFINGGGGLFGLLNLRACSLYNFICFASSILNNSCCALFKSSLVKEELYFQTSFTYLSISSLYAAEKIAFLSACNDFHFSVNIEYKRFFGTSGFSAETCGRIRSTKRKNGESGCFGRGPFTFSMHLRASADKRSCRKGFE